MHSYRPAKIQAMENHSPTALVSISPGTARRFLLTYQGLSGGLPPAASPAKAVMAYLHRIGSIQYDPLNIVGRNPELVLQARVPGFTPEVLYTLLYKDRRLVDGWDKMMCIYPAEDWPHFRPLREAALQKLRSSRRGQPALEAIPTVRAELEARGPLSSADLKLDRTVDWSWAPTKLSRAALEAMFHTGEIVVHHRRGSRKFYDLAHRHLPPHYFTAIASEQDYSDWRIRRRIGSVGLLWERAGDGWLDTGKSAVRTASLDRLQARDEIVPIRVEGIQSRFFIPSNQLSLLKQLQSSSEPSIPDTAKIIAPLDNLMWDRTMIEGLFRFRYRWEVYKPAAQREFGYYVLPILYGDRFIARFEPGRDPQKSALIIKNWWWEAEVKRDTKLEAALQHCFSRFCRFLAVDTLELSAQAAAAAPFLSQLPSQL